MIPARPVFCTSLGFASLRAELHRSSGPLAAALLLLLLLGGGCGRAGPPVRASRAPAQGAATVQAPEPVADEPGEEEEEEPK